MGRILVPFAWLCQNTREKDFEEERARRFRGFRLSQWDSLQHDPQETGTGTNKKGPRGDLAP